jgi:hypothetical protein
MNGRAIPGACALVEDKCLNHFKNILKKKKRRLTFNKFQNLQEE